MAIAHDAMILMHALEPLDRKPVRTVPNEVGRFTEMSEGAQRLAICDYVRRYNDYGLFGEAINEHRLGPSYIAQWMRGDTAEAGRIADIIHREYIGRLVQQEWDGQS